MRYRWLLGPLAALTLAAGCGLHSNVSVGGNRLTPEWEVDSGPSGAPRISGYIHNNYGLRADRVQVLVEALDASEQVVSKRYQWVPGGVPANNRSYFEVRNVPRADHYRVSVPYYTYEDGPGGGVFRF